MPHKYTPIIINSSVCDIVDIMNIIRVIFHF